MEMNVLLAMFLFLISILIYALVSIDRTLRGKTSDGDFVVNYNVLLNVIELYKETILLDRIENLKSKYDLNEKSPTNSRRIFETAKSELISETVKEIIKNYLSKDCLQSLLKYYSIDGLSLLIITHLKR